MSVAFRRDSDEEHLEPKFELPLPSGPNLVTPRGRALLDEKIAALEAEQPHADEDRRTQIARELRYWNTRRVTAILAPAPPADEVAFGSRVRFRLNGKEQELAIVGDDDSLWKKLRASSRRARRSTARRAAAMSARATSRSAASCSRKPATRASPSPASWRRTSRSPRRRATSPPTS